MASGLRDQFYLTLPSNSSINYYPTNTTANYTTHLPRSINLSEGGWEVALVELHYPCTFPLLSEKATLTVNMYSVGSSVTIVTQDAKTIAERAKEIYETVRRVEPPDSFSSLEELLTVINRAADEINVEFRADPGTKRVTVVLGAGVARLKISPQLSRVLGFDGDASRGIINANVDAQHIQTGPLPADTRLALPQTAYVYCDLVEPQFVGDTMAPLLRVVDIDTGGNRYQYGANRVVRFHDPHYVGLIKGEFDSVEIDLRDDTGEPLPFGFGTSSVKLHFRKSGRSDNIV